VFADCPDRGTTAAVGSEDDIRGESEFLFRCYSDPAYIWSAVVAHNLVLFARLKLA
jgi:hypothetical protein